MDIVGPVDGLEFNLIYGEINMNTFLGQTENDIGSVIFSMNASNFEILTAKKTFTVYDDEIKEIDGKFVFLLPQAVISGFQGITEIDIPDYILERKAEHLKEIEAGKGSIGTSETQQGKVYFFLTAAGMIKAKLGENEEIPDTFYTVEGKRVILFPGLDIPFVEIPENVEKAFRQAKYEKEQRGKYLVYAGRSLLTGKDYYRFSCEMSNDTLFRVKGQFEYFEPGDLGTLGGWLTSDPAKVEEYLRIRNPISSRAGEIEKQKEQAVKDNKKLIEKLMKC